jgi:hypothetical protein
VERDENYPKYAGDKVGNFTQNIPEIKWVNSQSGGRHSEIDKTFHMAGMAQSERENYWRSLQLTDKHIEGSRCDSVMNCLRSNLLNLS